MDSRTTRSSLLALLAYFNMAHFAKVVGGIVENIIVAEQDFIDSLNDGSIWVLVATDDLSDGTTIENLVFLKRCADIGGTYDASNEVFTPAQPYASWVLNELTWQWEPPVEFPEGVDSYEWSESTRNWALTAY